MVSIPITRLVIRRLIHMKNNQVLKAFKVIKVFKVIANQMGGNLIKDAISGDDDNNTNHYNKHKLMPQVILQSVFIILSANDLVLRESENSSIGLIDSSFMVSLLSISTKYTWIDSKMVIPFAESLFIKDEKDNKKQKPKQNDTNTSDHDEKKNN